MSVSTSVGPVSGIDYGKLIDGLSSLDQKPIDQITTRLTKLDQQNTAFLGLSTLMTGLKVAAASFASSAVFRAATATSANPGVINATAGMGTANGNYSFNVQRLASASQQVTQGFGSTTAALGLSGNITLRLGGGKLNDAAKLTALNGGAGVARGSIRVTDRSGASALIDLTHAVDINDVVNMLNSATGVNVIAKVSQDGLVITDNTGGSGTLSIANAGGTTTASDLGLTTAAVGGTLTGTSLTTLKSTTTLDSLNDGNGVRSAGVGVTDFSITGSGGTVEVALGSAKTVGDVIAAINTAGQTAGITAAISANGRGLTLTDAGGGQVTVNALSASLAAYDLGLTGTGSGGTLIGDRIISGLAGPLLRNLNGGNQGQAGDILPSYGTITINSETIDLSNARTLTDALNAINANGQGVTAALNDSGTGLVLSSSAGSFAVADGTGNLASFLQIAGTSTATASGSQISSGDLHLRYISENSRLSTLNGGTGVRAGSIRITAPKLSDGTSTTLTLDLSSETTLGGVISRLNKTGLATSARINDNGDGILLTQTGGTTQARIEEVSGGTTAANLGIAGTFSSNSLNGSFQKTIAITATDTLTTIATKINSTNLGVSASIINDGTGSSPYRLSLSSRNSGVAGRLIFDGSAAGFSTTTLVEGQDAALVYGGNANGTGGLLATSATNTFSNLVPGLTVNLVGVGSTTVAVTSDTSKMTDAVQNFVDSYNKVIDNIAEVTKYDGTNATNNGVLFADPTIQQVQNALGAFVNQTYTNAGTYRNLGSVGITVGQDGTLSLNTDTLNQALSSNLADVRTLFTTNTKAVKGGPQLITTTTTLSSLNGNTTFPAGHISITDGFGTAHDIDLTAAKTIGDVIAAINNGTAGTVSAGINSTGDGLALTQVGGTANAQVREVSGGTAASFLSILGTFSSNLLNNRLPFQVPVTAVKGVGARLSDLLDKYTNAQTGLLFDASSAIQTQETQLKERQIDLATLLLAKKNRLILQFANLEVTIAQLQSQGTALSNLTSSLSTSSSKSSS
jgi:flagellar hook-associated protein 2